MTIPSSATTNPAVATLSLKFACVKVKYDLLFDKTFNQDIFGDNGMVINSVTVDNVAKSAYLVTNKTTHADTRDGVSGNGAYYDSYTENQDNAGKTGLNVINVSGKVDSPSQPAGQWAYEATSTCLSDMPPTLRPPSRLHPLLPMPTDSPAMCAAPTPYPSVAMTATRTARSYLAAHITR